MAETTTIQNKAKKNPFGKEVRPDAIIYRLINKNTHGGLRLRDNPMVREDTPLYPPYIRFPNTDIISWNFGTDEKPDWGERAIRYLPGYASIFVDEQEAHGREIPEQVILNAPRFEVVDGEIRVRPTEKTKIMFLDYCNRNEDSPYRTGKIAPIFKRYSEQREIDEKAEKQEWVKLALEKAFSATDEQIAFQAKYLGVSLIDPVTKASRTLKAIKTDYQQAAMDDPKKFLETFNDTDLKMQYLIERAIEDNVINLTLVPGKAVWTGSKEEICEIPAGILPVEALFNFSQLKEGEALAKRLKKEG